jgi:alpha-D-ribose 1-methylphosphonate 5-triphosphate synthase subunit PhnG
MSHSPASPGPLSEPNGSESAVRQGWIRILAKASLAELEAAWTELPDPPAYRLLRPTEMGLAMVRGRIGGTGQPFNLGEMTMTRAAIQITRAGRAPLTGFGHVAGRESRRAELVALFDALLQDEERHLAVMDAVIAPIAARQAAGKAETARKVAASKVEFFTLVTTR